MSKKNKQKIKKYLLTNLCLVAGIILSLGSLLFLIKESLQTFKHNSIPQAIVEAKFSSESLERSQNLSPKTIKIIKRLESILKNYDLKLSHQWTVTLTYSLDLEQTLSQDYLSQDELKKSLKHLEIYLWRSYKFWLYQQSLEGNSEYLEQNLDYLKRYSRYLGRDLEYLEQNLDYLKRDSRYLERYWRDLELDLQYLEKDLSDLERDWWDLELDLQYLEKDLSDLERDSDDFLKQVILVRCYLLALEVGKTPQIQIEQISQSILKKFNQVFDLELSSNYGLTTEQIFLANERKQAILIQLSFLATLSVIGLIIFLLLLIRQSNQGITWSMTGMYLLPEECVAEMETLYTYLKSENISIWEIRRIMLWNILVLLKNFYIQVAVENLFLSSKNKRD